MILEKPLKTTGKSSIIKKDFVSPHQPFLWEPHIEAHHIQNQVRSRAFFHLIPDPRGPLKRRTANHTALPPPRRAVRQGAPDEQYCVRYQK